jgi:hypothetical protein
MIIGSGALVGTGAFSSVEADRTVDVSTSADSNALLQITEGAGASSDEIFANANNELSLNQSDFNTDAITTFDKTVNVRNTGAEDLTLYVDGGNDGIGSALFLNKSGGNSIVGSGNSVSINSSETVELDVVVDIRGTRSINDIGSDITLVAEEA